MQPSTSGGSQGGSSLCCCTRSSDGYLRLREDRAPTFLATDAEVLGFFRGLATPVAVGLDCEWPPSTRQDGGTPSASVCQLAVVDLAREIHVVVIDLLSCSSAVIAETVVQRLFEDETVVKVGYGLTQDVKALFRAACGSRWSARVSALPTSLSIDLLKFHCEFVNPRGSQLGLRDLASILLGVPLRKELQCSAWGERPLSAEQIAYAALDAACLLDLFERTAERLLGSDPPDHPRALAQKMQALLAARYEEKRQRRGKPQTPSGGGGKGKKKKAKGGGTPSAAMEDDWIVRERERVASWFSQEEDPRFLCDEMLGGLAKQLRSCGVDAELAERRENYERMMVELAERERRVILTSSFRLVQRNLFERILLISTRGKRDQLHRVLEIFRIKIRKDRLFTRCVKCNGSFALCTEADQSEMKTFSEVPEPIRNKHSEFYRCVRCAQIFWQGYKYNRAMTELKDALEKVKV